MTRRWSPRLAAETATAMVALLQIRMKVIAPTRYRLKISARTGQRPSEMRITP